MFKSVHFPCVLGIGWGRYWISTPILDFLGNLFHDISALIFFSGSIWKAGGDLARGHDNGWMAVVARIIILVTPPHPVMIQ